MFKWIGAVAGWFFTRNFYGAMVGYFAGYFIEQLSQKSKSSTSRGSTRNTSSRRSQVTPKDFELNLLSLASLVIKADGKVNQVELDYVRKYFVANYGKERANATFRTFNEVIKNREIDTARITTYISQFTRYESRLQIIHFLFGIANSDGHVSESELRKINEISGFFRIQYKDFESIKAMFFKQADNAYKILEIEKSATASEIKKAYRTMAKKYHPDKLQHLPKHLQKGAEDKFRSVQEAYDQLQKEKGFK